MSKQIVALNIDLGELPDEADELYALATTVNIACGGHAGDEASMIRAVSRARAHAAKLAAHPSYADREGFGRRARFSSGADLERSIEAQCAALSRVAGAGAVRVMKPHGALYHDASADSGLAKIVVRAAKRALADLASIVGPPSSALAAAAREAGLTYLHEGFADRRYRADGSLVPRTEPNAVLGSPTACADQAIRLVREGRFETICLHADSPGALENARAVHAALKGLGVLEDRLGSEPSPPTSAGQTPAD